MAEDSKKTDSTLSRLMAAMYSGQVTVAREAVDNTSLDIAYFPELFDRLKAETETAQVLIFGSYLEYQVESLIKLRLHYLSTAKAQEGLFGGHGPLDTFGSRIAIAYHLGWLRPDTKQKLAAFQKVRNTFAHKAFRVSLLDADMASRFAVIDDGKLEKTLNKMRSVLVDAGLNIIPAYETLTRHQKYLCSFVFLLKATIEDFLILPTALAHHVSPSDIWGAQDTPKAIDIVARATLDALTNILVRAEDAHHILEERPPAGNSSSSQ